jgi:hypothetical protein
MNFRQTAGSGLLTEPVFNYEYLIRFLAIVVSIAVWLLLVACQPIKALESVVTPNEYYRMQADLIIDSKPLTLTDYWRCGPYEIERYLFNAGPSLGKFEYIAEASVMIIEGGKAISVSRPPCESGGGKVVTQKYNPYIKLTDNYGNMNCFDYLYSYSYPVTFPQISDSGRIKVANLQIKKATENEYEKGRIPYNGDLNHFIYGTVFPPKCK